VLTDVLTVELRRPRCVCQTMAMPSPPNAGLSFFYPSALASASRLICQGRSWARGLKQLCSDGRLRRGGTRAAIWPSRRGGEDEDDSWAVDQEMCGSDRMAEVTFRSDLSYA
jgi:hypothetical protein